MLASLLTAGIWRTHTRSPSQERRQLLMLNGNSMKKSRKASFVTEDKRDAGHNESTEKQHLAGVWNCLLALGHCPQLSAMMSHDEGGQRRLSHQRPGPRSKNTSPQVRLIRVNAVYCLRARISKPGPGPLISQHACVTSCCASPVSNTTKDPNDVTDVGLLCLSS